MSPVDGAPEEGEAWLFPGQGAQYVGMGRELLARWPRARELFERAEALSGLPLRQLCVRGPAEQLRRPEVLEPALAALSLAHADRLHAPRGPPRYVAGYSFLGFLAPALVTAGHRPAIAGLVVATYGGPSSSGRA